MERHLIERDLFEREATRLKYEAEKDQADSEKIGFFKANKDRLRDDLRLLREDLEREQEALKEDRIRLDMHKTELRTRQKTIETLRFEFISNNHGSLPTGVAVMANAAATSSVLEEGGNKAA